MPAGRPKGYAKTGGMRKGYKAPATLEKDAAREAVRVRIMQRIFPLVDAQINNAIGIQHFMVRDKVTGQWERLRNVKQIEKALNDPRAREGSTYWIYTKDPNSQAAREMLDRAIDKPKEQLQEIAVSGGQELIAKLLEGRQRAAKAKK
jgi:hypothetical protein